MSGPWHAAVRGVHGLDQRGEHDWDRCSRNECTGRSLRSARLPDAPEVCYAHANDELREHARNAMKAGGHVDVRGTTLTVGLMLEIVKQCSARRFDFSACVFVDDEDGDATLNLKNLRTSGNRATFDPSMVVDFSRAIFHAHADFSKLEFTGVTFFDRTVFKAGVSFDRSRFLGPVWFLSSFLKYGIFTDTQFEGFAGFHNVRGGQLAFTGATFSGPAALDGIGADRIDMSDVVFAQRVVIVAHAHCLLDGVRFEAGVELRLRGPGRLLSLRRAHFGAASTVSGSDTVATRMDLGKRAPKQDIAPVLLLSLQDTDVSHMSVANIDLSQCLFAGAQNLDKIRLEGQTRFLVRFYDTIDSESTTSFTLYERGREILAEEKLWQAIERDRRPSDVEAWLKKFGHARTILTGAGAINWDTYEAITPERLAVIYRALRKAREDAKDEPGAGDFYYGEMHARRHASSTRWFERWLLTAYWLISGYGQRAGRAFAALLVLLAALTVLLMSFGLPANMALQQYSGTVQPISGGGTGQMQVTLDVRTPLPVLPPVSDRWNVDRLERAARLATGSVVFRDTDLQLTPAGRWIANFGRALGPVLLALALLAIRARVKR